MLGRRETYDDDMIEYKENVDMLLWDLECMGLKDLTKERLNKVLQDRFSIGSTVRKELFEIFTSELSDKL